MRIVHTKEFKFSLTKIKREIYQKSKLKNQRGLLKRRNTYDNYSWFDTRWRSFVPNLINFFVKE